MAAGHGLPFGTHFVFTYGPLGFLISQALYYSWSAILAFAFTIAVDAAIFVLLLRFLRKSLNVWLAFAIAFGVGGVAAGMGSGVIATGIWAGPEQSLALVLAGCVVALAAQGDPPRLLWVALGAALALFSLVKVSVGIGIVVMVALTLVCLRSGRGRAVGQLAVGFVVIFSIGWFGTGNGVTNVVAFFRGSFAVINGYSPAMSVEIPSRWYNYWLAAAAIVLVVAFAVARCRSLPRRAAVGVALTTLVATWIVFKEGFVRHDPHDLIFFAVVPVILAALSPPVRAGHAAVFGLVAAAALAISASGAVPMNVVRPVSSVQSFFNEASTLASASKRAAVTAEARVSLRDQYALPLEMVAAMRGHTVDVDPEEQSVVWAYPGIRFDPLPVIQDYSAYTTSLDEVDVNYLLSSHAPKYILRRTPTDVDGRNWGFDPPTTQLTIECRYRQVSATAAWQLLERGTDRCGRPRRVGTISLRAGAWVQVPHASANDAVVAAFSLPQGLWWDVEAELFKPPPVYLDANHGSVWRFVPGTAGDLHVLQPASNVGYEHEYLPPTISALRFEGGSTPAPIKGVTVTWFEVPFSAS